MAQHRNTTKASGGLAKGTVSQKWGFARRMLEAALRCGKIPFNPAADLSPNGGRRARGPASALQEGKTLNQQEQTLVLAVAAEWVKTWLLWWPVVLFALMALAGLRFGEARAVQLTDLEFDFRHPKHGRAPRIHVQRGERLGILGPPKHGKSRYVAVVPILEALIRQYMETLPSGTVWLFPGPLPKRNSKARANYDRAGHAPEIGWCVSESRARRYWRRVLVEAKLGRRLGPKALRHAFCTIALSLGESLEWVSREMGHRDILITQQVYGRWAQPRGLGKLAVWLAAQRLPERSLYDEPDTAAVLAQHGLPPISRRPGAPKDRTPVAA